MHEILIARSNICSFAGFLQFSEVTVVTNQCFELQSRTFGIVFENLAIVRCYRPSNQLSLLVNCSGYVYNKHKFFIFQLVIVSHFDRNCLQTVKRRNRCLLYFRMINPVRNNQAFTGFSGIFTRRC